MEQAVADSVEYLRSELEVGVKEHGPRSDSFFHNGGTTLALAATTAATIIPASSSTWARIAAGVATFVIALSRALDFGGRWRWHIAMRAKYTALLHRVEEVAVLPAGEQLGAVKLIFDQLVALRSLEEGIPGAGEPTVGQT
jgi:hypothetical protein